MREGPCIVRLGSYEVRKGRVTCWDHAPAVGEQIPIRPRTDRDKIHFSNQCLEHIVGPDFISKAGYKPGRISHGELRVSRTLQCLAPRQFVEKWQPEADDHDLERESDYLADEVGPLSLTPPKVSPGRHDTFAPNAVCLAEDFLVESDALPFHPYCFAIYMADSRLEFGGVNANRLMNWLYSDLYRDYDPDLLNAVRRGQADTGRWCHVDGDEWLGADPYDVPQLRCLFDKAMRTDASFDANDGAFSGELSDKTPLNEQDPFSRLEMELKRLILDDLHSDDIASLRLASRAFYQLRMILWHHLIQEAMPWIWEVWDDEPPYFWATTSEADIEENGHTVVVWK